MCRLLAHLPFVLLPGLILSAAGQTTPATETPTDLGLRKGREMGTVQAKAGYAKPNKAVLQAFAEKERHAAKVGGKDSAAFEAAFIRAFEQAFAAAQAR